MLVERELHENFLTLSRLGSLDIFFFLFVSGSMRKSSSGAVTRTVFDKHADSTALMTEGLSIIEH